MYIYDIFWHLSHFMMPGPQSLSSTYEQSHVSLDLLTLTSFYSATLNFRIISRKLSASLLIS